jgi:hypothetical protein
MDFSGDNVKTLRKEESCTSSLFPFEEDSTGNNNVPLEILTKDYYL